jgi:hypothetical protein
MEKNYQNAYPDPNHVEQRMLELIRPIDMQILMCDDRHDLLMLACAMSQRVIEILDQQIGVEGRKKLLKGICE